MNTKIYHHNKRFVLESGLSLPTLEIAYHTYGTLNADKSNVIWAVHAFTANSDVFDWWKGLFGPGCLFNPDDYYIVCANNLGSCYGTTGPLSVNPDTDEPWYSYFPQITIRDMAQVLSLLAAHLGISKIHTLIGGSQGGQIAQEWLLAEQTIAERLVLIATNAQHSPWGVAFNESQRLAIRADRTYASHSADGGAKGMQAARSIALLSYRNYAAYDHTQKHEGTTPAAVLPAASYQRYQGEKLVKRFNAYSYVRLSEAMDSHHVARGRAYSIQTVLQDITARTLVVAVRSDLLFPPAEQQQLATGIPGSFYREIDSLYGHDGFLIETEKLVGLIREFYEQEFISQVNDHSSTLKQINI